MQNLFDFLKDALARCGAMFMAQFNDFFIKDSLSQTQDRKLCYSSDTDGLVNCNRKMFFKSRGFGLKLLSQIYYCSHVL